MSCSTHDFLEAGLEVKHGLWRGRPALFVRNPKSQHKHQREQWWLVDKSMTERMQEVGVMQAFDEHTLLGDLFHVKEKA